MKITGELLKSERINQNHSIQDIALALKLSTKIITAIEMGNVDALPAKTFVRGFVKSYAQLLKLDSHLVLRQFLEEMGSTNPLPKTPPPKPITNENNIKAPRPTPKQNVQKKLASNSSYHTAPIKNEDNKKNIFFMLILASTLVVVLIVSNKVVDRFRGDPVASAPSADAIVAVVAVETAPVVESVAKEPLPVGAVASPPISKEASEDISPAKIDANAISVENGFEKSTAKPVEVLLEAKKSTEIFYGRGDAKQLISLKLATNQIQVLRSEVGLYLKTADSSAIKITVNGVLLAPTTGPNKEIKLTF